MKNNKFKLLILAGALAFMYLLNNSSVLSFAQKGTDTAQTREDSHFIEIKPHIDGIISRAYFNDGDAVKAGQILYELDDYDIKTRVERIKADIKRVQLEGNINAANLEKLKIRAPFSGQVTNIRIRNGEMLSKGQSVLTLTDTSRLRITVPFSSMHINDISPGQPARICVWDFMGYYDGRVTYVSKSPHYTSDGGKLYNVEVEVDNPGAFKEGMQASVDVITAKGPAAGVEPGRLQYINALDLKTEMDGKIIKVNVRENQYIEKGQILLQMQNDTLSSTEEILNLKLQELHAQLRLEEEQLKKYKILAPADGTLVNQTAGVGSTVNAGQVISVIQKENIV